jgi:hypothetical protein
VVPGHLRFFDNGLEVISRDLDLEGMFLVVTIDFSRLGKPD